MVVGAGCQALAGERVLLYILLMMLLKNPSAWIPIALSLGVLAMLLITLATAGLVRQQDEGVEAHLFQVWLVVELLLIGRFGVTWLPNVPKQALMVLTLQMIAALAACFPVFYFNL
jgi:hypothetical protein